MTAPALETQVEIVATGAAWLGAGVGLIDTALNRLFEGAKNEICLTAYSVTYAQELIVPLIRSALGRGVRIHITVNKIESQPESLRLPLLEMRRQFPYLEIRSFDGAPDSDLHAKIIVADRMVAIVGSSNLTRRGMNFNFELALVVRGAAARDVARAYDRLQTASAIQRVTA